MGKPLRPTARPEEGPSPRFRFEPGSYGAPGGFMPSIACLKQVPPNEWEHHFVIVRPGDLHVEEDIAVAEATQDLARQDQQHRAAAESARDLSFGLFRTALSSSPRGTGQRGAGAGGENHSKSGVVCFLNHRRSMN